MLSRSITNINRFCSGRIFMQPLALSSTSSSQALKIDEKDPAPYFFNEEIHQILRTMTRPDPAKVFRRRLDGSKLEAPKYEFMTDEQLEEARREADRKMNNLLQMPPVVKCKKDVVKILCKDPGLDGFLQGNLVVTDITYEVSNKDRLVVVREPDGTLRYATRDEKSRMNQIYFPNVGREVHTPRMFNDEYLQPILKRGDYEFILDRTIVQFDPDDIKYQEISAIVYDYIDDVKHYEKLISTRHYGPMVFYYCWNQKIDNLMMYYIDNMKIEDAVLLLKVYYAVNDSLPDVVKYDGDDVLFIKNYIEKHAANKTKLNRSIRIYLDLLEDKKEMKHNIEKAHGKREETQSEVKD